MYIAELTTGTLVDGVFFVREVAALKTKSGRTYLAMKLTDKTGVIEARIWQDSKRPAPQVSPDTFINVAGGVENFRGHPRINVRKVEAVDPAVVDLRAFLPCSYRDTNELKGYLEYFLMEIYDRDYSHLLRSFFGDREFLRHFFMAPGDLRSHHAYLGGLAEHTVSVATLCQHACVQGRVDLVKPPVPGVGLNADLLLTAALLHDVGKVEAFTYRGRFDQSREGRMIGHILLGQRMIRKKIRDLDDFPRQKELPLLHALISHHGELEWGAPKKPQSAEALVLHHVDNLDARIKGFLEVVEGRGEVSWPELSNYFRRPLDEPRAADRD